MSTIQSYPVTTSDNKDCISISSTVINNKILATACIRDSFAVSTDCSSTTSSSKDSTVNVSDPSTVIHFNPSLDSDEMHTQSAIQVSVAAFEHDSINKWAIRDPQINAAFNELSFEMFVRSNVNAERFLVTQDGLATMLALEYPQENTHAPLSWMRNVYMPLMKKFGMKRVTNIVQYVTRFQEYLKLMDVNQRAFYKEHGEFIYVASVGVSPLAQGRGYARSLFEKIIEESEETQVPLYLEATCKRNSDIFNKFGFVNLKTVRGVDPQSPEIFLMARFP